jgi:hypothetical protein
MPNFRKLHYHEQITVIGWPHILTDMQSVNADRPGTRVPGDQEELGHVDHRLDHTRRL